MTIGIPPNVSFMSQTGCKFGAEFSFPHWKFEEQPNKRPKKGGDKSAVAIVKSIRQLGCVTSSRWNLQRFHGRAQKFWDHFDEFDSQELRQANIRDNKGSSLGKNQVKSSHQRSPYAVKFEDRCQEETERQERCARGDA